MRPIRLSCPSRRIAAALWVLAGSVLPASACETALLLAIDVSNSVDQGEYRLQIDGLADALLDDDIAYAMEQGQVALSVMQWSGATDQEISIGWTQMRTRADVLAFSNAARALRRAFIGSNTATGDAILAGVAHLAAIPECGRHVIDMSGDGSENAGSPTAPARRLAERQGVTINGLAIESLGLSITGFYRLAVITPDGFVMTARGHRDYARAIREKIRREVTKVSG